MASSRGLMSARRPLTPAEEQRWRAELKDVLVDEDHDRLLAAMFMDERGEVMVDLAWLTDDVPAAKRRLAALLSASQASIEVLS